jgi:hypothetical protein
MPKFTGLKFIGRGINSANAKFTAERSAIFKPLGRAFMISYELTYNPTNQLKRDKD